jgi:hypothetical protein
MTEHERPFPVSKEFLDTSNSVSWFLMDALWMLNLTGWAMIFLLPTLATGLALLYIEKRRSVFWINLSINSWIWMNTFWMFERIDWARNSFFCGLFFIGLAVLEAKSFRETFSHFRRFRILPLK